MSAEPDSISIVYEEVENRPTIVATGAYGGPAPDGSVVVAHLFTDFGTIPSIEEYEVTEGGLVNLETGNRIKRGDVTRRVQATLVLSPESCIRLATFLQEKGRIALDARKNNPV